MYETRLSERRAFSVFVPDTYTTSARHFDLFSVIHQLRNLQIMQMYVFATEIIRALFQLDRNF